MAVNARKSTPFNDVTQCSVSPLNKIADQRGNLVFIESEQHINFPISRVYYLYDVPTGESRAGHGHKQLQQLIIAASGSFTVHIDDGRKKTSIQLNDPSQALYVCPMIWREIDNFSSGSVCLVLASMHYDEQDYYRNYQDFLDAVKSQ